MTSNWGLESRPRSFLCSLWDRHHLFSWILEVASSERETTKENRRCSRGIIRVRWLAYPRCPWLQLNLSQCSRRERHLSLLRVRFAWKAAIMHFIRSQEIPWSLRERMKTTPMLWLRPLNHQPRTKWPREVLAREHASNDFYLVCF
jgi:hypothetical protein